MATCRNCGRSDHWTYSRGHDEEQGYWECYRCECGETVDAEEMREADPGAPREVSLEDRLRASIKYVNRRKSA